MLENLFAWCARYPTRGTSVTSHFQLIDTTQRTTMAIHVSGATMMRYLLLVVILAVTASSFTTRPAFVSSSSSSSSSASSSSPSSRHIWKASKKSDDSGPTLQRIPSEEEGIPIPFVDLQGASFIECYADSFTTINGVEYTIGVPCDYAVALCYFDDQEQLIPVELDDDMMDDVFPIAASIVEEEFGEELSLHRTPQTLTLVGELEEEEDEEDDDDEDDMEDGEEEVEILLSFEHRGKEFNLVRLLDPVLLVGKADPENGDRRVLLSVEESEQVMPVLEDLFLEFHEERDLSM